MKPHNLHYLELLKSNKISNTRPRAIVFEALYHRGHSPISMSELIELIGSKIDRASIYRSVTILEKVGIIKRVQTGWKYTIELSEEFHDHHHHLTCLKCGAVVSIPETKELEDQITRISAKYDFSMKDHELEIIGSCKNCR